MDCQFNDYWQISMIRWHIWQWENEFRIQLETAQEPRLNDPMVRGVSYEGYQSNNNQHGNLTLTVKTNCSPLLHNHNDVHWLNGFLQMKIYVLFSPPFIICCIRTLASGTKGDNSARGTSDDGRCFVLAWGRHAHQFLCHLIPNPSHQNLCVYYYIALKMI